MARSQVTGRLRDFARARRGDLYGIGSLIALSLAFVSPAAKDGPSVGGFDLDTTLTPLGQGIYHIRHALTNGDAVSQMVAWNDLSWRMIHAGQFPLWNHFSALGMPQFLNFESSVLSLPDLLSYLVPARFAFLVVVVVKLVIASTGAYTFARVLGCRPLSSTLAGIGFMFSGAFSSWLTWPLTDVFAWSGWICAFSLLCIRPTGKFRHVVGLAIAIAFSIYGGFPEANIMLGIGAIGLVLGAGAMVLLSHQRVPTLGLARTGAGLVSGGLLASPLWLPGLQVISISHRESEGLYAGLPTRAVALLFSQGYYGLPTGPAPVFQLAQFKYYEAVSYVGVIALALAVVAIGTSIRRPVVAGLAVALLLSLAITYEPHAFHPLQSLLNSTPYLKMVRFERMRTLSSFLIAILAALGLEQLIRAPKGRSTRRSLLVGVAATTVALLYLDVDSALKPAVRHVRFAALVWPTLTGLGLIAVAIAIWVLPLRGRAARILRFIAVALIAVQTAFLFFAGVGIASYSTPFFQATPAIAKLQSVVGDSLVGLNGGNVSNVRSFRGVGLYPNVNIGYSIRIFGVHDPLLPAAYFASWPIQSAAPSKRGVGLFVPDINSVALAERYGIAYVLTKAGVAPPTGMRSIAVIAGETLSRVPGAAQFSFVSGDADHVSSVTTNGDGAWSITTSGDTAGELALRVTAEPGFKATIDGKPLALRPYDAVMMQARIPAGHHQIDLKYEPTRLLVGLAVALATLISLVAFAALFRFGLRRRRPLRPR